MPGFPQRLEEIAGELGIDTSDLSEPIEELCDRLRAQLIDARSVAATHFEELEDEIDDLEFDDDLIDQDATATLGA